MGIGLSRYVVENLVKDKFIKPFFKHKGAKALYRTWQLLELLGTDDLEIRPEPAEPLMRRYAAKEWLGVPPAELESWVRLGWVGRITIRGKGYYSRDEIKQKILYGALNSKNASKTLN